MKTDISKSEAREKIDAFFAREEFSAEEARKIKRLAMKFKIRLGDYKKLFCKKCLSKLEGRTRFSGEYKTVVCKKCGERNRFKMNRQRS